MKTIKSYPKIFHIGENYIENLFKSEVEITEKIDGSQWCMGVNENGELVMRSKGEDLTDKPVPKMFEIAKEQSERIYKLLKKEKDIYFYCEFLAKPHHNILTYNRIPKNNLYLFGVRVGENFVSDFDELCKWAVRFDIEPPYLLYRGNVEEFKDIESLLERDSILGDTKIEGFVIKNYEYPAVLKGFIIPISMGKYVSEKFKEKHKTEWSGIHTSRGKLELLIDSYRSEARWQKAVQHLKEKNQLENAPRDIGKLFEEIERDLFEEESENIKNELFELFKNDILRKSQSGVPEWYKKQLAEKGFIKNEDSQSN